MKDLCQIFCGVLLSFGHKIFFWPCQINIVVTLALKLQALLAERIPRTSSEIRQEKSS